jgi:membrane protein required for beta-lactamase induction
MKTFFAYVFWVVISGPIGLSDAGFNAHQDNPTVFSTPTARVEKTAAPAKSALSADGSLGGAMLVGHDLMW